MAGERVGWGAAFLVVGWLAGGCAGGPPADAPPAPPGAAEGPAEAAPPFAPTPPPVPADWVARTVARPALKVAIPPSWQEMPVPALREMLARMAPKATGDANRALLGLLGLVDQGRVRFATTGPSTVRPWTASVVFVVDEGAESLEAAAARSGRELAAMMSQPFKRELAQIELPIGPAIRAMVNFTPEGGAPTQSVEYILRLPEGVTLRLLGSNRQGDEGFIDLMGVMARSLSR